MHSQFTEDQYREIEPSRLRNDSDFTEIDSAVSEAAEVSAVSRFHSHFEDCMEMYAEAHKVAEYFDNHQNWFCRCAHPMMVEPLGKNGYALLIGRFGAFGYEVEPKVGLELLPQDQGIYRIQAIPVPGYVPPGYDVDFQASQTFVEVSAKEHFQGQKEELRQLPDAITRVEWQLDLRVALRFPKFINKLPQPLVQKTGDRVLRQVVKQVSRRLTQKVQEDFHTSLGLPIPKKGERH
ncbi:MAG: DUF1997 domain-containing protein [Kastovskya adunca ATA6-11-RM4]|jgi:hypothetical protein|nr:DUF1997 domain-containing protein [Kastovskya adunca ATA6-11-RM4]